MALLFVDSFDHYASVDVTEKWTSGSGNIGAGGRRSSNAMLSITGPLRKILSASGATGIIGFAYYPTSFAIEQDVVRFMDGATSHCKVVQKTDGTLAIQKIGGAVLATTTFAVVLNAFYYLEFRIVVHASTGAVELRIDGTSRASASGVNTQGGATATWNQIGVDSSGARFDDIYVLDGSGAAPWNTFIGDCRVDVCRPTGPGASAQWTPSAGANWQCVDETPPNDDTDYTSTPTVGHVDTFAVQDAPSSGEILGVQVVLGMRKTDAGACSVAPVVRHAGVDQVGPNLSPATAYAFSSHIYPTNPGTSVQFTVADFNAAEFGYKRTV